jgi:hypothetical protein
MMNEKINFDDNEDLILICAFRYALGRRTYVVGTVADIIKRNWNKLRDSDKKLICKEILDHKKVFGNLGDSCDERDWMSIVDGYNLEKSNKIEGNGKDN